MTRYLVLLVLIGANTVFAQIYKWTDELGQVHFSDVPSTSHQVESVTVEINSYEHVTFSSDASGQPYGSGGVVMYSTTWCPYCKKARDYFRQNGISYVEYDIETDSDARREYDALGAKGVPVILVGKKRMNGFSPEGFERLYR